MRLSKSNQKKPIPSPWQSLKSSLFKGLCLAIVLGQLAVMALPKSSQAQESKPTTSPLRRLIEQLGDNDYSVREQASLKLRKRGEAILPMLRRFRSEHIEPEGRMRCHLIARLIMRALISTQSLKKLRLKLIEEGAFFMGSNKLEEGRRDDEGRRRVKIKTAFLLSEHEITQGQYQAIMGTNPSWFSKTGKGAGKVKGKNCERFPVDSVSFYDALEFCNRLSKKEGFKPYYQLAQVKKDGAAIVSAQVKRLGGSGFRLPTEEEWEYSCRAMTSSAFHFGRRSTGSQANVKSYTPRGAYGMGGQLKHMKRTTMVGRYRHNAWTLYDMHGNVGEWCDSRYSSNPLKPQPNSKHFVVRGGSWLLDSKSCRSASRGSLSPDQRQYTIGFRIARTP